MYKKYKLKNVCLNEIEFYELKNVEKYFKCIVIFLFKL